MKRYSVLAVMLFVGLAASLWTWHAIVQSVLHDAASDWIVPGAAVSIVAIALVLAALVAPRAWHVSVGALMCFATALLFVQSVAVVLAVLVATLLVHTMVRAMHTDMAHHLRIHVFRHAQAGSGRLITALALMISAVFYTLLVQHNAATLMLSHSLRATATGPIARMVLPAPVAHGSGPHGEATVDDFIRQILAQRATPQQGVSVQFLENYAAAVTQRLQDMVPLGGAHPAADPAATVTPFVVAQARAQLARELNRPLTGSEPVADVFVQSLQDQVQAFAEKKLLPAGYTFSAALAGIITLFLFLTLGWLGAILKLVWFALAQGVFRLLVRTGAVTVALRAVQQEYIAS